MFEFSMSGTYPIASFTYLILPKGMSTNPSLDQTKAKALVDFISSAKGKGEQFLAAQQIANAQYFIFS
jgi:phosphate transport system permease protein/phosphate transport system substrate-binding protein